MDLYSIEWSMKGWDTVGQEISVTCDVQQLLGNNHVRPLAMSAIDGMMRGMEVIDTGTHKCFGRWSD